MVTQSGTEVDMPDSSATHGADSLVKTGLKVVGQVTSPGVIVVSAWDFLSEELGICKGLVLVIIIGQWCYRCDGHYRLKKVAEKEHASSVEPPKFRLAPASWNTWNSTKSPAASASTQD